MSQPSSSLVAMLQSVIARPSVTARPTAMEISSRACKPREADRHGWPSEQSCGPSDCSFYVRSLGDETGGGAQSIGFRAERRQRGVGLGDQRIEPRARAVGAQA